MLLTPYTLGAIIAAACLQLVATYADFPGWYRIMVAVSGVTFVVIFEYLRQYQTQAWNVQSRLRRSWDLFMPGTFTLWTQMVCWEPVFDSWFRIMCLVIPLGSAIYAHIRQYRNPAVEAVGEVAADEKAPAEA